MSEEKQKLQKIVSNFDTAMLITTQDDSVIRARPMRIAEHDDDGEMWFVTARQTSKVDEIEDDISVAVVMQTKGMYACLSGMATIRDDKETIERLWSPTMRPWFPDGVDSGRIVAIRFVPLEGEYWDTSGLEGIKYIFKAAKAVVTGETVDAESPEMHATVAL